MVGGQQRGEGQPTRSTKQLCLRVDTYLSGTSPVALSKTFYLSHPPVCRVGVCKRRAVPNNNSQRTRDHNINDIENRNTISVDSRESKLTIPFYDNHIIFCYLKYLGLN